MEFSALENVVIPQMVRGLSQPEATKRATDLLAYLGLKQRLTHLAGGTLRRRALGAYASPVIVLDKPKRFGYSCSHDYLLLA